MFPNEIWEKIVTKITDRKDLIKLRSVNYTFYSLIEPLVKSRRIWEKLFTKRMSPWKCRILSMISPNVEDQAWELTRQKYWRKMVLSYKKWRRFADRRINLSIRRWGTINLMIRNENITCIAVWVNTVAVATNEGLIHFHELSNHQHLFSVNNVVAITRMEFWYADNNHLMAIVMDETDDLTFWSLDNRKRMKFSLYGTNFCVGSNNRLFVLTSSSIKEYSFDSKENLLVDKESTSFDYSYEFGRIVDIYQMSSENEMLQVMISVGSKFKIMSYELPLDLVFPTINESQLYDPKDVNLRKPGDQLMIIPNSDTVIIVHNEFLTVGVDLLSEGDDKWESHQMASKNGIHPTCIAMHANILFIGLSSGYIHLYAISSIHQLLKKERVLKKLRKIKISESPVIAIKLTEKNKVPYIVASTHQQLYSITLY